MGEHNHEIVKAGFVNVREVDSTGNEMEFEESTTLDHDKKLNFLMISHLMMKILMAWRILS